MISDDQKRAIHAAADALVERGERPTLAAVRDELGGGSYTSITEGMRSWREARAPQPEVVSIPQELADQGQDLIRQVWESAQSQAQEQIAAEREALAESQREAEAAQREAAEVADQIATEAEELRQQLAGANQQAANERARAEEAETRLAQEQQRAEQAERRAEAAEGERDRLAGQQAEQQRQLDRLAVALERLSGPEGGEEAATDSSE